MNLFCRICFFSSLLFSASVFAQPPAQEMFWDELLPDNYQLPDIGAIDHSAVPARNPNASISAPVRSELNGKMVKIPGFVVPLEGDDLITEFLLVPYFGACIHSPPPPPNQIIHVTFPEGAPIDNLYDAVWITGELSTQSWSGDLAEVGYSMTASRIIPYDE